MTPVVAANYAVNASYGAANVLKDQCEADLPLNAPFPQKR